MLHLLAYRVVVGWNTSTAKTISHAYTVGCGHVFSFPITGFKFWMTLLLFPPPPVLLFDFTQFFSDLFLPLYLQKFKDKVTEREHAIALRTLPPLPHLSPFIFPSASWGTWKSYCRDALWLAQWSIVPSLSSSGQNESGVAVHDDRIYVVGGYSIWTNEPLACIQVSLQSIDRWI